MLWSERGTSQMLHFLRLVSTFASRLRRPRCAQNSNSWRYEQTAIGLGPDTFGEALGMGAAFLSQEHAGFAAAEAVDGSLSFRSSCQLRRLFILHNLTERTTFLLGSSALTFPPQ